MKRKLKWEKITTTTQEIVRFADHQPHTVTFLEDVPIEEEDSYNKQILKWRVLEDEKEKSLIVSSIRLAQDLKKQAPLKGKTFTITRSGGGMKTIYEVKLHDACETDA